MASSQQAGTRPPVAATKADAIPWATMSLVIAAMFMAVLDSFIVVVADPSIVKDLHASTGDIQWVLAGYQLSYAVFIITATRLADLYGRKRIFLLGVPCSPWPRWPARCRRTRAASSARASSRAWGRP